jgi:hypothetical protein
MSNTLLNTSKILDKSLMILENNLAFSSRVNKEYSDEFAIKGAKVGSTVNVRKPVRFVGTTGPALAVENVVETVIPVTLDTQFHVDFEFSSSELTLNIDDFAERYLAPAMATIANKIDLDGLGLYTTVGNQVGVAGTTPNDIQVLLDAGTRLDQEAAPRDGRRAAVWDPAANGKMVKATAGLFNAPKTISDQYASGIFVPALGFDIGMDQNVRQATAGTRTNGTVSGAGQTGNSLLVTGLGAGGTVAAGDTFTIAGVFAVNPQSRQSTRVLRQFTSLTAATADGSGNATLLIFPAINTAASNQQYQTVTAGPANAAVVTWDVAASTQYTVNMAYHKNAFTLATADLEMPEGVDFAGRRNHKGISMRIVRQYAIGSDQFPCRIDVLYGWRPVYNELACRIAG